MSTAITPVDEALRLQRIQELDLSEPFADPALDELTSLAARTFDCPVCAISIVGETSIHFPSRFGADLTRIARESSFCSHAIQQSDLFIVPDATRDQRFASSPMVTTSNGFRFYAGAPLHAPTGEAVGTLCLLDHAPREFADSQRDTLRILARQVLSRLENRRQSRELHENQRFLSALIRNIPGMAYRCNLTTSCIMTFVSDGCRQITGYEQSDLEPGGSIHFPDLILPSDREEYLKSRLSSLENAGTYDGEFRIRHRNGEVRWLWERASSIRDQDGHLNGVEGFVQDITARREADALLRESEARLKFALDATDDGLWDWDIPSGRVYFSPQWARLLGYDPAEVPQRVEFFYTVLHPEDVERVNQVLTEHMAGRLPVKQDEVRLKMRSGEYRWFFDRGKVVTRDESGAPTRMVGTISDISERKKSEQALRVSDAALKSISQGVLISSPEGVILSANRAFLSITQYSESELIGSNTRFLRDRMEDQSVAEAMAVARKAGQEFSGEVLDRRKDGTTFWNDLTVTPVRNEQGRVSHFIAIIRDVTERKLLEEQLRKAQKMEAIGQLASGIAHDFNNILAAIIGNAEMTFEESESSHPGYECVQGIKKATIRAKSLVQQILTFSRQQSQERRIISLEPVLLETVKLLRATIPSLVELVPVIEPGLPKVLADSTRIHQVLVNLCTNAWHAMEGRPGRIDIHLKQVHLDSAACLRLAGLRPGVFLCLQVRDNGHGIEPDRLERIFDPFYTTKAPGIGTGLGLSVVHGIVENHEGRISVSSTPGHGTTFDIFFPVTEAVAEVAPEPVASTQAGRGQRILFLDDEIALVAIGTRMLKRLGYEAAGFTSSMEALKRCRENPAEFDLVITDFNMPGASGLNVASELMQIRPDLPVVLCSGSVTEELRSRARECGIRDVLHKPNTVEEFRNTLSRIFE